ncbi:Gfo/Idh/MocA family protein [Paenibacillus foliorum]|nr:Gfo/Idh/MocA family oxidoreductase [Paenibacillus foliorum]
MSSLMTPKESVKIALIGTGQRSRTIYAPLFEALKPWVEVVAVCDPFKPNAEDLAARLQVPAYYNIRQLVKDRPMEAALIVTPIESHHSISVYLSSHGIHNMSETTWCNMIVQAKEMIAEAHKHNVIVRVAENFFRYAVDRFAQKVKQADYIGPIRRVFSYNDHTGFHNNSRWIVFARSHPQWVQSVKHTMDTAEFYSTPERFHAQETFRARYFMFPDDLMVIDQAANIKGLLGRQTRPGYTEWQGLRGTLVHQGTLSTTGEAVYYAKSEEAAVQKERLPGGSATELRYCSDEALKRHDPFRPGGLADHISEVIHEVRDGQWTRTYAHTPHDTIEYVNELHPKELLSHHNIAYGSAVMGHIVDFALAVRGMSAGEFDEQDGLMSLMMEIGAEESALQEGRRVKLPLEGELEADRLARQRIQQKLGVDPLDVEGMLSFVYPKP